MNRKEMGGGPFFISSCICLGYNLCHHPKCDFPFPPFTFNAVRFFLGGISLLIILLIKEKGRVNISAAGLLPGIVLGSFLFLGYAFQTFGLLYTTPAKAGFLTGLSVVLVPFFAFLLSRQKPAPASITGALAAALGLYFLAEGHTQSVNIGDFLVMVCALGFALHIIFTDRYTRTVSALELTVIQILTVAVLSFISMLLFEDWQSAVKISTLFSSEMLSALIITALLATSAAYLIQTTAQKHTTPARVAVILTMEPVFAALFSYLWIGEELTSLALIGCSLIFLGMLLAEIPQLFTFIARKKSSA